MKLLHIDSSILGDHSVSRQLSANIVARLKAAHPGLVETYRDLGSEPIPHLSGAYLAAAQIAEADRTPAFKQDLEIGSTVLEEFLAADVVVIGVAFYNFTIASQLKAWIDRILVAGRTFRYGADGPEGLAGDKRVILAIARGGFYGVGSPTAGHEHAETYLRSVLDFIGISNPEVVIAEGIAVGPDHRTAAIAGAGQQIAALAA